MSRLAGDSSSWKSVTRVLREREHRMVQETVELLDALMRAVEEQRGAGVGERAEYLATRLGGLRTLASAAMAYWRTSLHRSSAALRASLRCGGPANRASCRAA